MSTGGLTVALFIAILLNVSLVVYILVKYRASVRVNPDPDRTNTPKANLDLQRSKAGMEEYERQVVLDLLRDQLKYSQEDYSELQGEMKALRVQVAKLENGFVAVTNRLDGYRLLLSQILEAVSKK